MRFDFMRDREKASRNFSKKRYAYSSFEFGEIFLGKK